MKYSQGKGRHNLDEMVFKPALYTLSLLWYGTSFVKNVPLKMAGSKQALRFEYCLNLYFKCIKMTSSPKGNDCSPESNVPRSNVEKVETSFFPV